MVERVEDLEAMIQQVRGIVTLSEEQVEQFYQRVRRSRRPGEPVVLAENLSNADIAALAVDRHYLDGVKVITRLQRYYPQAGIAAHAVGSVRRMTEEDLRQVDPSRYRATQFVGKRGVEAYYESDLLNIALTKTGFRYNR